MLSFKAFIRCATYLESRLFLFALRGKVSREKKFLKRKYQSNKPLII